MGTIASRSGLSCSIREGSRTCALLAASYKFCAEISQPQMSKFTGSTMGSRLLTGLKTSSR